jgi:hypothetical protein
MPSGEYLRKDQERAVNGIIRSAQVEGVRTLCGILFGSRARGEARPDSDVDLMLLLDFPDNESYLRDPRLLYTRHFGHTVVNFSGEAGRIQVFMYNWNTLIRGIEDARLMPEEGWVRGLAGDGQVIYGKEPMLSERPFLKFLRERFESPG